jgi:hypothetical protein
MGEAAIRPTALAVASLILILSDINMPEISGLEPRSVKGLINGPDGPEIRLPLYPRKRTQVGHRVRSETTSQHYRILHSLRYVAERATVSHS